MLGQSCLLGINRVYVCDLDTEVIQGATLARVLQKNQLEWRLINGEVGIAGATLGRLSPEQFGVEGNHLIDVIDVEGEL